MTADDVPRVYVIVPFLEQERFLSEAVESVLAQTYDDWGLLLVDGGSTDASPDIVRENADRRPGRIVLLAHPNGAHGPPLARNAALRHAAGDYVAFLDAGATPVSTFVQRALADDVGGFDTTVPDVYLSAQGFQDSGVYATLERQPFDRAQPLLSRVSTRFRLGA